MCAHIPLWRCAAPGGMQLRLHSRALARLACSALGGGAGRTAPLSAQTRPPCRWQGSATRGAASMPPALGAGAERVEPSGGGRLGAGLVAGALLCAAAGRAASAAPLSDGGAQLTHRIDSYGGVVVDVSALPSDPAAFTAALEASVACWLAAGRRGVWLQLPLERAALVAPAVAAGFVFHHAEPGHLMLTRWLPAGPSPLPPNASHQVGVGAFVLNTAGEVLVVQERAGPAARPGFWKLPTGLVNQGEEIHAAAVREVAEETGVDAEFVTVMGVRQAHSLAFGKDDMFFLCALRLKDGSAAAPQLTPQAGEIAAAAWISLADFGAMPHVADPGTVWGHLHVLCGEWAAGRYGGIEARSLPVGFGRAGHNTVYTAAPPPPPPPPPPRGPPGVARF
jgi:8-oxo-dGTP pyrophosphatase MutT (NUDIX family)